MSVAFALALLLACGDEDTDSGSTGDGGATTGGGSTDGGSTDGGSTDGGTSDGGSTDGGSTDGGSTDGGTSDGGASDGGTEDGGSSDGGSSDGGSLDGGSSDGGASDGGSSDGGSSDGGSSSDYTFSSGRYTLSIGDKLADTCRPGGSGEAIPAGASVGVTVTVAGSDLTIELSGGADITWTGTVDAGELYATQETVTDFSRIGYDCQLQYTWWIDQALTADDTSEGTLGLDYTPVGGKECDVLAAEDGWTFPCGWSVEASLSGSR